MLYRPKFCANCGEKISRDDWGIFTSRRFCPVCESEYKGTDLIPRFVVGAGLLIGVLGIGGYLKSGQPDRGSLSREPKRLVEQARSEAPSRTVVTDREAVSNSNQVLKQAEPDGKIQAPSTQLGVRTAPTKPADVEQYYYCGAETKKGTPCSRRVKGNTRCFQHLGMPAMVGSEKLKVN